MEKLLGIDDIGEGDGHAGLDPPDTISFQVALALFPLHVIHQASYELLGRYDVEIHPIDTNSVSLTVNKTIDFTRYGYGDESLKDAKWIINSELIAASNTDMVYRANAGVRSALIQTAFTSEPADMWEAYKSAYQPDSLCCSAGLKAKAAGTSEILVQYEKGDLPYIVNKCALLLNRAYMILESTSDGDLWIRITPRKDYSEKKIQASLIEQFNGNTKTD